MNKPARIDMQSATPLDERLFTATDFARMIDCGAFEDMRIELVGGVLERMAPALGDHGSTHLSLGSQLLAAYRDLPVWLANELAIRIDEIEVRGADIAVVNQDAPKDRYVDGIDVVLLVEIAKTTLGRDLGDKSLSYARARVQEYWVVDLPGRATHLFRALSDGAYAERELIRFGIDMQPPGANGTVRLG